MERFKGLHRERGFRLTSRNADNTPTASATSSSTFHVAYRPTTSSRFDPNVFAIFGKYEFKGSYCAQLRSNVQSGSESVVAYAARTTDMCLKVYLNFTTKTILSLAFDHIIAGLADATLRDYLVHD